MNNGKKKLMIGLACLLSLTLMVGNALATNLITNGDFETSGIGPNISDYATTNIYDPAQYVVGFSPANFHNAWADYAPYQGSFQMIVNGAEDATMRVWATPAAGLAVTPNTNYLFSAWVRSSYLDPNMGNLQFQVNGAAIGTIPPSFGGSPFNGLWNSGAATTANLAIYDLDTSYSGNDFTIDAISFSAPLPPAAPLPPSVFLLGSSLAGLGLLRFRKRV